MARGDICLPYRRCDLRQDGRHRDGQHRQQIAPTTRRTWHRDPAIVAHDWHQTRYRAITTRADKRTPRRHRSRPRSKVKDPGMGKNGFHNTPADRCIIARRASPSPAGWALPSSQPLRNGTGRTKQLCKKSTGQLVAVSPARADQSTKTSSDRTHKPQRSRRKTPHSTAPWVFVRSRGQAAGIILPQGPPATKATGRQSPDQSRKRACGEKTDRPGIGRMAAPARPLPSIRNWEKSCRRKSTRETNGHPAGQRPAKDMFGHIGAEQVPDKKFGAPISTMNGRGLIVQPTSGFILPR